MTTPSKDNTRGVLVRGADGSLYFVPNEKLQAYKVPDQGVATVDHHLPQGEGAKHVDLPTAVVHAMPLCII